MDNNSEKTFVRFAIIWLKTPMNLFATILSLIILGSLVWTINSDFLSGRETYLAVISSLCVVLFFLFGFRYSPLARKVMPFHGLWGDYRRHRQGAEKANDLEYKHDTFKIKTVIGCGLAILIPSAVLFLLIVIYVFLK